MKGDAVEHGYEEQRPVTAALCIADIVVVVDGEEDVGGLGEVGEGAVDGAQVGGPHEQKGHAGSEEADACLWVSGEGLALEVFLPKGNDIVTEPVVFEGLDVTDGETSIVVAEVGLVGCGELGLGQRRHRLAQVSSVECNGWPIMGYFIHVQNRQTERCVVGEACCSGTCASCAGACASDREWAVWATWGDEEPPEWNVSCNLRRVDGRESEGVARWAEVVAIG